MTEKAIENKVSAELTEKSGASAALASEALDSLPHAVNSAKAEAPAHQSKGFLSQFGIEIPTNCSAIMEHMVKPASAQQLAERSKDELACIFTQSSAGKIPEGNTVGTAIFMPGTSWGAGLSHIADKLWGGKVFDNKGALLNKILGYETLGADVYKGSSWLDGKESIIVDYNHIKFLGSAGRDEIREVKPGLYLGIGYPSSNSHSSPKTFFALESSKK